MKRKLGEATLEVLRLRRENPCLTGAAIAFRVSRSRQRVAEILALAGETNSHWKQHYVCLQCGKVIKLNGQKGKGPLFCSRACRHAYSQVSLICDQCGKMFQRCASFILEYAFRQNHPLRKGQPRQGFYCSRICYGKWFGQHYHRGKSKRQIAPAKKEG